MKVKQLEQEYMIKSQKLSRGGDDQNEVGFYKEAIRELEERIQNHINANIQLRERIEHLNAKGKDTEEIVFYKDQIAQLEYRATEQTETITRLV